MKRPLFILLASLSPVPNVPTTITLAWNQQPGIDAFYVYQSASVTAPLPWAPCTNTPGGNFQATFQVMPGQTFYYVSASNFWGETGPSNVTSTPTVATNPAVTIRKGP